MGGGPAPRRWRSPSRGWLLADARRLEAGRLEALGLIRVETSGWTLGPGLGVEAHLALGLHRGLEARLGGGASLCWVKVDGATRNELAPFAHLGLGYGF